MSFDNIEAQLCDLVSPDADTRSKESAYPVIMDFLIERLFDINCLLDVLKCIEGLFSIFKCPQNTIKMFLKKLDDTILISEQPQIIRITCLNILLQIIGSEPNEVSRLFLTQCFGEKDPRNLIVLFRVSQKSIECQTLNPKLVEDIFEACFCYFPISFTPPPDDPFKITSQQLAAGLDSILVSTFNINPTLVLETLIERLETASRDEMESILETLTLIFTSCSLVEDSSNSFWFNGRKNELELDGKSCKIHTAILDRLIDLLMKLTISFPNVLCKLFESVPLLHFKAKKPLQSLLHAIFLENSIELDRQLIKVLFKLGAVNEDGESAIWKKLTIENSPKFILFLENIPLVMHNRSSVCRRPEESENVVTEFCRQLEESIKFGGSLEEMHFISLALKALHALRYNSIDEKKIHKLRTEAFSALLRQINGTELLLTTLIETGLLEECSHTLYSANVSIQQLSNSNSTVEGFCRSDKLIQRESCLQNPANCCQATLKDEPSIYQDKPKDEISWILFLSKASNVTDDELQIAASNNSVWVRLAAIRRLSSSKLLKPLLSDPKRIVRKIAASRLLSLQFSSSTGCCKEKF